MAENDITFRLVVKDGTVSIFDNFERRVGGVSKSIRNTQQEAKDALQLLGNQLGVQLPREVEKFISKTQMIGPALASAFNVAIFVALGAALVDVLMNFDKVTDKLMDWSGAMKKSREELEKLNAMLVGQATALKESQRETRLTGLGGVERARAQFGFAKEDVDDFLRQRDVILKAREELVQRARETERAYIAVAGGGFQTQQLRPTAGAQQAQKDLANIDNILAGLEGKLKLATQAAERTNIQLGVEMVKAAEVASVALKDKILASMTTIEERSLDIFKNMQKLTTQEIVPPRIFETGVPSEILPQWKLASRREIEDFNAAFLEQQRFSTEAFAENMEAVAKAQQENYNRMIENVRESAGRVFDSMLTQGKGVFQSLGDFIKGLFNTALRNVFQNAAASLFGALSGKGGTVGGILGGIFGGGGGGGGGGGAVGGAVAGAAGGAAGKGIGGFFGKLFGFGGGGGQAAGAVAGKSAGMVASLGSMAATAGISLGVAMLGSFVGGLFNRGAKRRAEEAARRAAVQEGYMFAAAGPIERVSAFGAQPGAIEESLTGKLQSFSPVQVVVNQNIQAWDGESVRRNAGIIAGEVGRAALTGAHQLQDNIAWAAE